MTAQRGHTDHLTNRTPLQEMEGAADLAPVEKGRRKRQTMSVTAEKFRDIIMDFKVKVLRSLDDIKTDKHNEKWLNEATDRIFQMGNTAFMLLDNAYDPLEHDKETNTSIQSTNEMFKSNDIDLQSLDDSTKKECKQIIEYDIYWYPLSISETHIESLVQNRVK